MASARSKRRYAQALSVRECLTIDVNVARAYLDERESGHEAACELFDRARRGVVELAWASSGYIFDARGDLRDQLREMLDGEGVRETTQLAYPCVMYPGGAYPGAGVTGFHTTWAAVIADWTGPGGRPNSGDALHVETHVLMRRDVFVTDDRGLVTMCRRLLEREVAVVAMTLTDYLEARPLT